MKHYSLNRSAAVLVVALLLLPVLNGAAHAQLIGGTVSSRGPSPGEEYTALAVGFFVYSKTDLSLPGPMPIDITRVYRSSDVTSGTWNNRDFGTGTSLNYDIFLYSNSEANSKKNNLIYTDAEVVMPDGGMIECLRSDTNPSSDYINATFACNQQPTGVWFGSTITFNASANTWNLKRPDGTTYQFGYNSPLQSITDRYNNSITIIRGPAVENPACQNLGANGWHLTEVPSGSVAEVLSSNGRAVYFCYNDPNNPTDISGIADNANPTIKQVSYTYDSSHRLSTATQYSFNTSATTTYQWNQGSSAGVGDITTIIVNDSCAGTNCQNPNQVYSYMTYGINALGTVLKSISSQLPGNGYTYTYTIPNGWTNASEVEVSLPDGANRSFYFDQAGYVTEDVRNIGLQSVEEEYTFFNRGQQTIGKSGAAPGTTEFIGQVQEESFNRLIERTTAYNYDPSTGNLLTMALSPAPGQTSGTATWTNTYTTYNRLASAVEPLSYNGVGTTYSYIDPPSQPTITVTDPLGRITTVTENQQGQPISVKDPMGYTSTASYTSAGDLQSVTDPIGNTTTFQPDADGRVLTVTSPLRESSTYKYDALDDVTDVYAPLGNHTKYTYNLIGGEASVTTPNGNTTTTTNSPSLATTTVTDPNGNTTVANLDGQGRHTSSIDKLGVKTTYGYDQYGRPTTVLFDANNVSGYSQIEVSFSNYDALDRAGQISESPGSTLSYTFDGLDNILKETQPPGLNGANSVTYAYDVNGRRTSLVPELNGVNQATINYGYDCADELVAVANNGSVPSCSPSNSVTNGSTNTQVGIIYDSDGMPTTTVVDGIETLFARDSDERVTAETYQPIATGTPYGTLTYRYNPDSHMVDEGGSLAVVTMPQNETETFSKTDQLLTWNVYAVASDPTQTNISGDPSTGLTYVWDARNQLTAISPSIFGGYAETYDPTARRQVSSSPTDSLSFLYDGGGVAGWVDSPSGNLWSFLTVGGAALAGSYTTAGTTTTWVPLTDINGSTIGLVNPALPTSPPGATYTYDPSGNVSVSGSNVTSWPFQYQGMEHEITDPANLYFNSSSNVYNPQIQNALSQVGAQGLGGSSGANPAGPGISPPSGQGGGSTWQKFQNDVRQSEQVENDANNFSISFTDGEAAPVTLPLGAIAGTVDLLVNLLEDLFSGSENPPIPRQLMHKRHPLYKLIGIQVLVDEGSSAPVASTGAPSSSPPLQLPGYSGQVIPVQFPGYNYCGPGNNGGTTTPNTTDDCCKQHDVCYGEHGLTGLDVLRHLSGETPGPEQQRCDQQLCECVNGLTSAPLGTYDEHMRTGITNLFCY